MSSDFDGQVAEGFALPFSGWDFSAISGRWREGDPPWNYAELLREQIRSAQSMVDLGTGGGEFLASLAPLPPTTFATEGYPPNVALARRNLAPLGVRVLSTGANLRLDLSDRSLDLVADRHEEFSASEVYRVLRPGGWFITQQVGARNNLEFRQKFGVPSPRPTNDVSNAERLADEVAGAGLTVRRKEEATYSTEFGDIGAVVFYLRAVPWEVPGFSLGRDRERLKEIDDGIRRTGSFRVTAHRLLIVAQCLARRSGHR